MNDEHDPIVCASRLAELDAALGAAVDTNQKAVEKLALAVDVAQKQQERIVELERNRDEFQQRRDEAIREAERKTVMLNRIIDSQPIAGEVAKICPQPGDLLLVSVKGEQSTNPDQVKAVASMMLGLKNRFPGVTFITSFGVLFDVTQMSETELRKHGLIAAVRVDAGVQQLEVAFGAQKTALERCRSFLNWAKNWVPAGRECGELHEFLPRLEGLLQAELVPEERPTRETLTELLKEAQSYLGQCSEGDGGPSSEELRLSKRIDDALHPKPQEGGQLS